MFHNTDEDVLGEELGSRTLVRVSSEVANLLKLMDSNVLTHLQTLMYGTKMNDSNEDNNETDDMDIPTVAPRPWGTMKCFIQAQIRSP